jgi:hypothetical protein
MSRVRFLRSEEEMVGDTWEKKVAIKYYDKLFKEYCLADLSRHKVPVQGCVCALSVTPAPGKQDRHAVADAERSVFRLVRRFKSETCFRALQHALWQPPVTRSRQGPVLVRQHSVRRQGRPLLLRGRPPLSPARVAVTPGAGAICLQGGRPGQDGAREAALLRRVRPQGVPAPPASHALSLVSEAFHFCS